MATRAPERGRLERRQVARAEVLATDATGVLARTEADPDPWPSGPFPPPPDRSRPVEGRLRIEAVADTVLRVRYAPGPRVRDGGQGMLVGAPPVATSVAVEVAADDDVLDYFVLFGSPAAILAGYTALTGRAPVPPAWSFGWWQSRCSYASADEVLAVVEEMRAAGVPMDVVHLDTNWFAVDWRCDLEFAPDRFGDPAGFCRALADRGVHLSLWQMPYLVEGTRLHDRLAGAGGFVRTPGGDPLDIGSTSSPATPARCT